MTESDVCFTVVIPCFNRSDILRRALESCAAQTYKNFEVIVVDDGSTEDIESVVTGMSESRFKYVRQENGGASSARNNGFSQASGSWIALLDSDDHFLPTKLEVIEREIRLSEADMYFSRASIFRDNNREWTTPESDLADSNVSEFMFCHYQVVPTSTFVIKRSCTKEIRFDESLVVLDDIDFIIRFASLGRTIRMVPDVLVVYDDSESEGRLSRYDHGHILNQWIEDNRQCFTNKSYHGFRATYLSKYLAKKQPLTVLKDIYLGYTKGGVSAKLLLRRSLRAYAPTLYERLVMVFLWLMSKKNKQNTHKSAPKNSNQG